MSGADAEGATGPSLAEHGEAGQAAALSVLRALTGPDGAPAEEVVTHISRIFLVGEDALKLKRARLLPFLDFSDLPRRAEACRREIQVNHAAGDQIYLGVSAIIADPAAAGGARLGEIIDVDKMAQTPNVIDWVVRMRRFDRAGELDRLAESGGLSAPLLMRLADRVAEAQTVSPLRKDADWPRSLHSVIRNIDRTFRGGARAEAAQAWAAAAGARLDALGPQLSRRRRRGFVRRLHGDMHLGNICVISGRPVPFDAIEFSEEIASIDVLYDVAFTAMDLIGNERRDLAAAFTSRYFARSRDYRGLSAWPLFLSVRAGVRAMTARLGGEEALGDGRLALAAALLAAGDAPARVVAIGGLSGTGKTTWARALAPDAPGPTGAVVLSTDEIRKRLLGLAPEERAPPSAYRPDLSEAVYRRQLIDAGRALDAGASVILDGVFGVPQARAAAQALAARRGARFDGFWLHMPKEQRLARVRARQSARTQTGGGGREAGDASDADPSVAAAQRSPSRAAVEASPGWRWLNVAGGWPTVF